MTTEEQIRLLERRRCEALQAGDVTALDGLLDSAFVYVHGTGRAEARADYLAALRDTTSEVGEFIHDELTIRRLGDCALVTGILAHNKIAGDTVRHLRFRFTAVWAAQPDGWLLTLWHNTKLVAEISAPPDPHPAGSGAH